MTLYLFNKLNELMQAEVLWEDGVPIDERIESDQKAILYQLYAFYVEVFYDLESGKLKGFRSFKCTKYLMPYLEKIDLQQLLD